jgi:hypothetical protein
MHRTQFSACRPAWPLRRAPDRRLAGCGDQADDERLEQRARQGDGDDLAGGHRLTWNARDALSATAHAHRQAELSVKVTTVRSEVSS